MNFQWSDLLTTKEVNEIQTKFNEVADEILHNSYNRTITTIPKLGIDINKRSKILQVISITEK